MIECIFTIDYEIYGNGEGSLKELVYEPAKRLMAIFRKCNVRFVPFIEVAELEMIEAKGLDGQTIDLVKQQIRAFYNEGFELGLHLHPQWYNAVYENGKWHLDYSEYNLCTLPRNRITDIVKRSITYLRNVLGEPDFTPLSFRAGNWLFQPTRSVAEILTEQGIRIDSSVFKGGRQYKHGMNYRQTLRNGYYWSFSANVNIPDPKGKLIELPIYTSMVPFWKMLTAKRVGLQRKSLKSSQSNRRRLNHILDYLRFCYPLKFDFCRMTTEQLISMVDKVIEEDRKSPAVYRPLVAIGHTKDLVDFDVIDTFLSYLKKRKITVTTFSEIYSKCQA